MTNAKYGVSIWFQIQIEIQTIFIASQYSG